MGRARDIQFRAGNAALWTSVNPVLDLGEPGFESDSGKVKIGDGVTAWTALAYLAGGTGGGTSLTVATTEPKPPGIATAGTTGQVSDAGHVHPRVVVSASTVGSQYKGWTLDEMVATSGATALNGGSGVQVAAIVVEQDTTIANLTMLITTAGTVTTAGQCFAGIYSATGTLLAQSADVSAQITSTGVKTFPMAAPTAVIPAGTVVYGAILINGVGTSPQFGRQAATLAGIRAIRFGVIAGTGGATSLPGSFSPTGNSAATVAFFMAVS